MAKLDVAKAAFAGFGVIRKNPGAVAGWALFLLVVAVLPVVLLLFGMVGSIASLAKVDAAGGEPTPDQVAPLLGSIFLFYPLLFAISLLTRAVLTGAVFRAVLEPSQGRWAFMRLGMQELWILLVSFVLGIVLVAAYFGALIPLIPIAMFASGGGDHGPTAAMAVLPLYWLAVVCGLLFLAIRMSMAVPMSFATRSFKLFESWSFTRGNFWNLVLVGLILLAVMIGIEMIVIVLVFAVLAGTIGMGVASQGEDGFERAAEQFFNQDPGVIMASLAPWVVLIAVVGCLLGALVQAIFLAPWAEAYRQLTASDEPSPVA